MEDLLMANYNEGDIAPYKKKSKSRGLHRADHKHTYEVVLLTNIFHYSWSSKEIRQTRPTKVCSMCGRIGDVVKDPSYYDTVTHEKYAYLFEKKLSDKALALPRWEVEGHNKFATKEADNDEGQVN